MARFTARLAGAVALIVMVTSCSRPPSDRPPRAAPEPLEGPSTVAVDSAVRVTARGFSAALARGDSAAVMALLHPDATIFESGHAETRDAYRSGHLAADLTFASAVRRRVLDERVIARPELALYTSEYTASGEFRGRAIDLHGTESMVLVRTPEGWKIRHIHWSSR